MGCAARVAAMFVHAWCEKKWPGDGTSDGDNMASTVLTGELLDVFDFEAILSHKYLPAEQLTQDLGMEEGAGVFAAVRMYDGSYILKTCNGPLAWWSGQKGDKAEWGD